MKRVRMDLPEVLGKWQGPITQFNYIVAELGKVFLIQEKDRDALCEKYGKDKLPIV